VSLALGHFWLSGALLVAVAATALRCSLRTLRSLAPTFLHRNYCLHVGALLAAVGADHSGALMLLGAGACTDSLREDRVIAALQVTGRLTSDGQWARGQMRIGCAACLIGLLLAVLACALAPVSMLPDGALLRRVAHVQRGVIPAVPGEAGARGGCMTLAAVAFILVIELGLTWKSTALFAGLPRSKLRFRKHSLVGMTLRSAVFIGVFYAFGVGPLGAGKLATAIGPDFWSGRLAGPTLIGFVLWSYYVFLTTARLGSGLIYQSQKMTVAAMQMAEKKVWAHRS
jgi:hypothetical protein